MILEFFQVYLPILGIRLLNAMDKVDEVLDNMQRKVNSLNGLFSVIDFTTDKISAFSDKVVDVVSGFIGRFTRKKNKKRIEESEEEDYE